jgi:hypothetical protein
LTDQEMRMCPGCGRQIPAAYNVCPHCGRPANAPPQYGAQPAYGPQPYGQPYPPQPQEPLGAIKYILYLLSLSIIIGFIIFILWNNDPNPEKRHVAKNCLIIGIAWIILWAICWVLLAAVWTVSM